MGRFYSGSVPIFAGLFLITACSVLLSPNAYGQVTTGSIEGTVRDENGKPAPDVEIVAKNQSSGYYQLAYTSDNGKYRIPSLTPGTYQIRASNLNFAALTKTGIQVQIDEVSIIDFTLTSKGIQEKEVVVEAQAPIVDTKNSDLSTAVRPEQINSLPLNSRNFLELASVAPGAKVSVGGRGPITTGAVNSRFISAYIDGGEFKSDGLGGVLGTSFGQTTNIVPEDAISQFQVITTMYKAEFSDASNGVINAITKSGGNEIHGSAFGYFRAQGLNAQGVFDKTKPNYNRQQMGFSVGGPIVIDQTHYFVSYERDDISNFLTVNTGGKLNGTLDGTFKSPTTENLFLARITHQFSQSNVLDMRYLTVSTDNNPGNFGGTSSYSNGFNLGFRINSFVATDRWTINNNTVNEFKLQYQHYFKDATPVTTTPEYVYQTFATGWNPNQPQNEDYQRLELRNDLTYMVSDMAGSHAFKAGVDFEREPLASAAAFDKGGVLVFKTDTSSAPYEGIVASGNPQTRSLNYKYGLYVQDDWTVVPKLTLNLGLRWDVETNMIDNSYMNPLAGDTALTNHVPANYIGDGNRPIDYGRIAPRLGFAYDVFDDHSTAVHGGFGIFYDRFIYNLSSNEQQNGVYNIYTIVFNPATAPVTYSRDSLLAYIARGVGGAAAPGVSLNPSSVPSPYTRQITVGVSRELTPDISASLDYIQIRGFNEYTTYNVNYQNGLGGPRVATKAFAAINLLTSAGKSWYDAYQFSVTRPYLGDWQMQFSYTLSWADNTFDDPFQGYVFQSNIVRAPSLQDERHHFVLSGIVDLPYGFQLSGLMTLASPHPYGPSSAVTGSDNNSDGTRADDFPGGPAGRNSLRPETDKLRNWYKDVDLRITKNIEIVQSYRLALFVEAFNLFNWTSYSSYFTTMSASNFGHPNGAYPTRQVQLGVRASF